MAPRLPRREGGETMKRLPRPVAGAPWTTSLPLLLAVALLAVVGYGLAGSRNGGPTQPKLAPQASAPTPHALQQQLAQIVRGVSPSVVQIESAAGLGSGVVYDQRGHIVTNAYVVGASDDLRVTLADGRHRTGRLVGHFVPEDLAVVKIAGRGLRPAHLERSASVSVGDIVLAIGNPLGLRSSVTEGVVSAVGRTVAEPNGAILPSVVQTSAPINRGNSGGALVDLNGRLIGIPTIGVRGGNGIGFAIASDRVRLIADQLIRDGRVVKTGRAYLGIRAGTLSDDRGVLVAEVVTGGTAAAAGIRAGDVITAIAGRATPTTADLLSVLADRAPGDTVAVRLIRGGAAQRLHATLGELPAAQAWAR
jgi:putative serine protease PepD